MITKAFGHFFISLLTHINIDHMLAQWCAKQTISVSMELDINKEGQCMGCRCRA